MIVRESTSLTVSLYLSVVFRVWLCGIVVVCCSCLLMCSFCIVFLGGSGVVLSVRVGMMASFLPAATDGSIPTVFDGWAVGLMCGVSGLLELCASFICACLLCFKS